MDTTWVLGYLREALGLVEKTRYVGTTPHGNTLEVEEEFNRRLLHLGRVLRHVAPGLEKLLKPLGRSTKRSNGRVLRQALYTLEEGQEVLRRLGPSPGPTLRADALHPTVWDAARSLWRSNHRRQAVEAAATSVNAALQNKLGRRDVSNTKLVNEAFTLDLPKPGKRRLRLWPDDGSETYRTMHEGARSFAAGCFQALRNVVAHEKFDDELFEQIALEQLAAFSIVARWVEQAVVVAAPDERAVAS